MISAATRAYLLHSGDLAFVRQNLLPLERMLACFVQRRINEHPSQAARKNQQHWHAMIRGARGGSDRGSPNRGPGDRRCVWSKIANSR